MSSFMKGRTTKLVTDAESRSNAIDIAPPTRLSFGSLVRDENNPAHSTLRPKTFTICISFTRSQFIFNP